MIERLFAIRKRPPSQILAAWNSAWAGHFRSHWGRLHGPLLCSPETSDLQQQVQQLSQQVQQLQTRTGYARSCFESATATRLLCLCIYRVGFPGLPPALRVRVSGTGFVVADGLVATNRHVAEPWYEDAEASALIRRGAAPQLEQLLAFFPGMPAAVNLTPVVFRAMGTWRCCRCRILRPFINFRRYLWRFSPPSRRTGYGDRLSHGRTWHGAKSPTAIYDRLPSAATTPARPASWQLFL